MGGMTVIVVAVVSIVVVAVFVSRFDRGRHLAQSKEAGLIASNLILEAADPGAIEACSVCDHDLLRPSQVCLQGCRLNPVPHRHMYCGRCATPHLIKIDANKFRTRPRALSSQDGEMSLRNEDST